MKYVAIPSVISLVGIAVLFSSFTLFLVDSWIKYPLFISESVAIITIYCVLNNQGIGKIFEIGNRISSDEKRWGLILDITLIGSASILSILNGIHTSIGGVFHLALALIVVSFLPGYALLNIFRLTNYFSKLEILILSFIGSFVFSAFVSLLLLPVHENMRTIIMPICFMVLGIVSAHRRSKSKSLIEYQSKIMIRPHSFSKNIDILVIVLCVVFYIMFFVFIYPNAAQLPGSDISRHYSYSSILSRSPELYGLAMSRYVLFHAFEAAVLVMTGIQQSVAQVQTVLVLLNVFLPISLYILAKRFLSDIDKRIPAISVIFYTILSNFSFIYYTQLKLLGAAGSQIYYLVADRTHDGNIYFLQPFPFFVPLSVSVILFVVAFLLLRENNLPRTKFVLLFSTIIFSMYLTHVAEAVVFTILLGIYSLASRSKIMRINDALVSSLISLIAAGMFIASTTVLWTTGPADVTYNTNFLNILSLFIPSLLISCCLIWRKTVLPRIRISWINKLFSKPIFYQAASISLMLIYLFGFLTWFLIEDLKTSPLVQLGTVPWFIYPVLLGIAGLLSILSLSYLRHHMPHGPVILLLSAVGFMFLLGRLISFVSLNVMILDYWEKRLLGLIFIPVCLLAPISLIGIKDRILTIPKGKTNLSFLKNVCVLVLVSIIVFAGFSSTALQSEYWFLSSTRAKISEKELEAVNFLKAVFQRDVNAYIVAPSTTSKQVLAWAAPAYQFPRSELLVTSLYPDLALATLDAQNLTHAYLYLHNRDFDVLKKEPLSWLFNHLLPLLPVIFSNKEVTIYNTTSVSFPVSKSNTALIIPTDAHDKSWFYAYDVVSQSRKNYTVMYDRDPNVLKSKNVILSFDPGSSSYEKFSARNLNKWEKITGNWNFSSRGLIVEDNSGSLQNVILSPFIYAATNLNISTSFNITKINQKSTSYVSFVYSWIDAKNYDSAGVTLRSDGIFLNFAKIRNGEPSFEPSWPGIKTNISWKPNDVFNMTLRFNETSKSIALNGRDNLLGNISLALQIPHKAGKEGYLGLSYGRGVGVIFDDFKIKETRSFPLDDYIRYVNEGGNLVVFDTNGFGEIASSVFNKTLLSEVKDSEMPTPFDSDHRNRNKQIAPASPVEQIDLGLGKLTYINLYPSLFRFFQNKSSGSEVYQTLGKISKVLNLTSSRPTFMLDEISAVFRNFSVNADYIQVNTSSIAFPPEVVLGNMKIRTGQKIVEVNNVSQVLISDYDHALLSSNGPNSKISMVRGKGLYTALTASNGIDQRPFDNSSLYPHSFSLSIVKNGTLSTTNLLTPQNTEHFYNVSSVNFTSTRPLEVILRQPTMEMTNGHVTLNEIYSVSDDLYRKTGTDAVSLKILGNVSMSIIMADTYALAKLGSLDGIVERVPALPQYNEFQAFPPNLNLARILSFPPLIILIFLFPFFIGVILLVYGPRKISESK